MKIEENKINNKTIYVIFSSKTKFFRSMEGYPRKDILGQISFKQAKKHKP